MDGRGRALDNVFVERLWRTVKYEEVYLKDYETPWEATQQLGRFFVRYNPGSRGSGRVRGFFDEARLQPMLSQRHPL
jgi:hypothetical protein